MIFALDKFASAQNWAMPRSVVFLLTLPISIGVAALSFRYFERPVTRLRHCKKAVDTVKPAAPWRAG